MRDDMLRGTTADGSSVALVRYASGLHQPAHAHGSTSVSLVLRGRVREDVGPTTVRAGVLDLVVKPAGTRHENLFLVEDTTLVQVVVSEETLRRGRDAGCPVDRWRWFDGAGEAARALSAIAGVLVRAHDATDTAPDAQELQAKVEDAIASLEPSRGAEGDRVGAGSPPPWIRRARATIDDSVGSGVPVPSVTDLAQDAGVHRVHFSREFRRYVGVSPSEYRQRVRLRAAAGSFGSSADSLSGAAYRAGFADQAHMTREFRRRLGVTPLEFRTVVSGSDD